MAFTAKQHHRFANQHIAAAKGEPSMYDNSDLSPARHYQLARQHRNAALGRPSNFDKIDGIIRTAPKTATTIPPILVAAPISSTCLTDLDAFLKIPFKIDTVYQSPEETLYRVSTEVSSEAYVTLAATAMCAELKKHSRRTTYEGVYLDAAKTTAIVLWCE